jgi:hypothetical protein
MVKKAPSGAPRFSSGLGQESPQQLAVAEAVGVFVDVAVGVSVLVALAVAVWVGVQVGVSVPVAVAVAVWVGVQVGVDEGVSV